MCLYTILISLIIGSFVQCLIDRYPNYFISKYSYCNNCNTQLNFIDLIPLFSYIYLKGKCRYCNKTINSYNFFTELFFLLSYLIFLKLKSELYIYILFSSLYLSSGIDIIHYEISDITIVSIILIIIYKGIYMNYELAIIILIIGLVLSKFNLIGFGDIKLLFVLSFFLTIYQFIIALLISCISALLFILMKRNKNILYFCPFISFGYFTVIFLSQLQSKMYFLH